MASYRQTCYAYPNGGGAFAVSKYNLGETAALVAASALLVDYVMTVAASPFRSFCHVIATLDHLTVRGDATWRL